MCPSMSAPLAPSRSLLRRLVPGRVCTTVQPSKQVYVCRGRFARAMSSADAASKKRKLEPVSPPQPKRKVQSTTTKSNVSAFFTPASQKAPDQTSWRTVQGTLLVASYTRSEQHSETTETKGDAAEQDSKRGKIAAFDLDSTLITTASGKKFARDATDWKWWSPVVPGKLRELYDDGHQVVIFSNQAGLSLSRDPKTAKQDAKRVGDFKSKVSAVLRQLDRPVRVYAATERDAFRKPRLGMWRELLHDCNLRDDVDSAGSFFVGDAGGRLKSDGLGADDFSTSDRDFGANAGIAYHTPEEYFLGQRARAFSRAFEPSAHLTRQKAATATTPFARLGEERELVLLCGSPGAGKSTFYWRHLEPLGYGRVNQDLLKTRERCLARAGELLTGGQSVVVDNTNADAEARGHWIRLAARFERVRVRCVRLTADGRLSAHNAAVRALSGGRALNPEARAMLPNVAFASFSSRFREPRVDEGFDDVTTVDFEFEGDDEQREVWSKYWT